jgi:PAS domain S-box-containing protein
MCEFGDDGDATPTSGRGSDAAEVESLRASEARIRALFEHAPDAVMVVDSVGRIKTANRNACHLLRYDLDELLTLRVADISVNYDQTAVENVGIELRASREATVTDVLRRSDGTTFPAEVRLSAVDSGGQTDFVTVIRDVTERETRVQALRDSEARYRDLVEMSPDAVFTHVGGRFTFVNHAGMALLGASSPQELLGQPIMDRVAPGSRELVKQRVDAIGTGAPVAFMVEETFLRLDGTPVAVEVIARPCRVGDETGVQVVARDISIRNRAEAANAVVQSIGRAFLESGSLEDSCARVAGELSDALFVPMVAVHAYDAAADEIVILGTNGLGMVNIGMRVPATGSLSGKAATSGETVADLDASVRTDAVAGVVRSLGIKTLLCVPLKTRQGVLGVLVVADRIVRPSLLEQRDFLEVVGGHLAQEIARRRAEQALADSELKYRELFDQSRAGEARYRALFNQVPVGLWEEDFSEAKRLLVSAGAPPPPHLREFLLADLDLVRQCAQAVRVLRVNQTAASMCGAADADELLGALDRVFTSESIPQFLEALNALMEGRVNFRIEGTNRTLQGEMFWIDLRCSVAPGHEQDLSKVLVSTVDMTDRMRAEQEREALEERLRHAEKMEAIGTLAGGVAHDFNNILAAIVGYGELALLNLPAGESARDDVSQIMKAAFRARDLVHQILAFSRQTVRGKRRFEVEPLVRETMNLLRAAIPANIEVRESIEQNAGAVLADPTQLHQVLMNLCTNARWAMREQASGVLEVKLDRLKLTEPTSELAAGDYVRLTVSDDGCGMDTATRERIFEPYFTTRPMSEGSGLGLAVVHGIVSGLGGTVLVRSVVGAGSAFEVFLPRMAAPPADERPPSLELPKGTERILFVDDEPAVTAVCERMLASLGYRVTATTSASDALELFRKDPNAFDLVITDQSMPRLTGLALTEGILSIRADACVLICTGYSDVLDESKALEVGARMLLMKPLELATLASAVRRALEPG